MRSYVVLLTWLSVSTAYTQVYSSESSEAVRIDEDNFYEVASTHCQNSRISPGQRGIYLITEGTTKSSAELSCAKTKLLELMKTHSDRTYFTNMKKDQLYRERFNRESEQPSRTFFGEGAAKKTQTFIKSTTGGDDNAESVKTLPGFHSILPK